MNKLIDAPFFTQFLKVSNYYTAGGIALLILSLGVMKYLKDKRINFSKRMIYALILGLLLGVVIDLIGSDSEIYTEFARTEINAWYALVGSGFLKMIQLLAIPVVFLSIIKVVIDVKGERLKYLTGKTFATLLGTTAISAALGIAVVKLYRLNGAEFAGDLAADKAESISNIASQSFPEFFLKLIPNNIVSVMGDNGSIVSVVIIAAMFAGAIRFLQVKKPDQVAPFVTLLDSLKVTVISVLTNVIKLMPYGVVALVSNTIISRGIQAIMGMIGFIAALYTGVLLMLIVYVILLLFMGVNPIVFLQKSIYDTIVCFFFPFKCRNFTLYFEKSGRRSRCVSRNGKFCCYFRNFDWYEWMCWCIPCYAWCFNGISCWRGNGSILLFLGGRCRYGRIHRNCWCAWYGDRCGDSYS